MSKYDKLWEYIKTTNYKTLTLTYQDIENIINIKMDHSFLQYKKDLLKYGYQVEKISLKNKNIFFKKLGEKNGNN